MSVCVCVHSKLTFTSSEDPLTPLSDGEAFWSELITRRAYSCLLIRSVLPYGPSGGSRQAGRQAGVGKVLDTCGTLIT